MGFIYVSKCIWMVSMDYIMKKNKKLKTTLQFEFEKFLEIPELEYDLTIGDNRKTIKIVEIKKKKRKFKTDASTRLF